MSVMTLAKKNQLFRQANTKMTNVANAEFQQIYRPQFQYSHRIKSIYPQ